MQKQFEKLVWEKSNDTNWLSVKVQTTINHISIQYQRQRKCFFFFSERELEKALRDHTLTRAAWYRLLFTTAN